MDVKTILVLLFGLAMNLMGFDPDPHSAAEWNNRGGVLFGSNHYHDAELSFKRAFALANEQEAGGGGEFATICVNLAAAYRMQARYSEAESLYRKALHYTEGWPERSSQRSAALRG
ncbi:MAG: hypothetical protein JWP08_965, partial [Bryobacterales bacterium]|nr:hypothetical protein [Bryobacterales bacterium]